MSKNKYQCVGCSTIYYTSEDRPPPTPRWKDRHECVLIKIEENEQDRTRSAMDPGK